MLEYKVRRYDSDEEASSDIECWLNKYAKDNWRLICISPRISKYSNDVYYILERERQEKDTYSPQTTTWDKDTKNIQVTC